MMNIAQQPPFRMVDTVLEHLPNFIRCSYIVKADNLMVINGKLSAEGMIECMAQASAAKSILDNPEKTGIGYLVSVKSFYMRRQIPVGEELIIEMEEVNKLMKFSIFMGKIKYQGEVITEGELRIFDDLN